MAVLRFELLAGNCVKCVLMANEWSGIDKLERKEGKDRKRRSK